MNCSIEEAKATVVRVNTLVDSVRNWGGPSFLDAIGCAERENARRATGHQWDADYADRCARAEKINKERFSRNVIQALEAARSLVLELEALNKSVSEDDDE